MSNSTLPNALEYIDLIKSHVNDDPSVYEKFVDIMEDFSSRNFLPPGYLIDVSEDHLGQKTIRVSGESTQSESYEYIKYLNKVENRFHHNPEIYMQFLYILNAFHRNESYSQVYNQVSMLFKDAPDLLAEFKTYFTSFE